MVRILHILLLILVSSSAYAAGSLDTRCSSFIFDGISRGECEAVGKYSFDFFSDEGLQIRVSPTVVSNGKNNVYLDEFFVENKFDEHSFVVGIKKPKKSITFDSVDILPWSKRNASHVFETHLSSNRVGTLGLFYSCEISDSVSADIVAIDSPAFILPASNSLWHMSLPTGSQEGKAIESHGGLGGKLSFKTFDIDIDFIVYTGASNTTTQTVVDPVNRLVYPLFGKQTVLSVAAEKSFDSVTLRSFVSRRIKSVSENYTRYGIEGQYLREFDEGNIYVSLGYFSLYQKSGSLVDMSRALTDHVTWKTEYESPSKTTVSFSGAHGLSDKSLISEIEIKKPINNDMLVGVKIVNIHRGQGLQVGIFNAYGNQTGLVFFISVQK